MDRSKSQSPLRALTTSLEGTTDNIVHRALQIIRAHMAMDVAYVSEFVDDRAIFRKVDAPGFQGIVEAGQSVRLDDVYCPHILSGRLPQLIPDTSLEPLAQSLPITQDMRIGKHLSVPIRLRDGSTYGMFCCLGQTPDPTLSERDLQMMTAFAELVGLHLDGELESRKRLNGERVRVREAIDDCQISMVYQPIWHLPTSRPIGVECLARFSGTPQRSPDLWFKAAAEVGLGVELELEAIRLALPALQAMGSEGYIALNASPDTIMRPEFAAMLAPHDPSRIVIEVTEHASIANYEDLIGELAPLRGRGLRLAVDDAGAGYSSFHHILQLSPDLIKLDMTLTRDVDSDPARRALAIALIQFAKQTSSRLIAEGVETKGELATLRAIGVEKAQGFVLGGPTSLDAVARLFRDDAHLWSQIVAA